MIVVDSSALVAILLREPERELFRLRIGLADEAVISAASILETAMVVEGRYGASGRAALDELIGRFGIRVVPFDESQLAHAREAFRRYGKGRHPARLNFGDCIAYALARALAAPLVHIGTDFAATDLPA